MTSESYSSVEVVMHWPMDSTADTLPLEETKMKFQPKRFDWSTGQEQLSEEELLLQLRWGEMGEERGKIRIHIGMKRCTRDGIVWRETKISTESEKRVVFQQYLLSFATCPSWLEVSSINLRKKHTHQETKTIWFQSAIDASPFPLGLNSTVYVFLSRTLDNVKHTTHTLSFHRITEWVSK